MRLNELKIPAKERLEMYIKKVSEQLNLMTAKEINTSLKKRLFGND